MIMIYAAHKITNVISYVEIQAKQQFPNGTTGPEAHQTPEFVVENVILWA